MSAVFVTVQSALLRCGYHALEVVAWFYTFGAVMVTLGVVPANVLTTRSYWAIGRLGVVAIACVRVLAYLH